MDQIARLFKPFSQVHLDTTAAAIGTGLCLFVSRGLVDLHHGRIWCESEGPHCGSTFAVALPKPPSLQQPATLLPGPTHVTQSPHVIASPAEA